MIDLWMWLSIIVIATMGIYFITMFLYFVVYIPYLNEKQKKKTVFASKFFDCVDLFFVADYTGKYKDASGIFLKKFNLKDSDIIGKNFNNENFKLNYASDRDKDIVRKLHEAAIKTGEHQRGYFKTIENGFTFSHVVSIVPEPKNSLLIGVIMTTICI